MNQTAQTLINPDAPALQRLRALIALMFQLIVNPSRAGEIARICEQAEQLLAAYVFDAVIRLSGRDDLRDTHEMALVHTSGKLEFAFRRKPHALCAEHRILLANRRARVLHRIRTALGARHRVSNKRTIMGARNQRRRHNPIIARHNACAAAPSHTPARIAAPP